MRVIITIDNALPQNVVRVPLREAQNSLALASFSRQSPINF
jgi:hypothetical protein